MTSSTPPTKRFIGPLGILLLGTYQTVIGILVVVGLFQVWGMSTGDDGSSAEPLRPDRGDSNEVVETAAQGSVATSGDSAAEPGATAGAPAANENAEAPAASATPSTDPAPTNSAEDSQVHVDSEVGVGPAESPSPRNVRLLGIFRLDKPTSSARFFLIVLFAGALGSWLHGASSYLAYVGNRSFVTSWTAWYLARPLVGAGLALVFYFVIRGGFFKPSANDIDIISDYGFAAFSALVGLFSDRAVKKLRDVVEVTFGASAPDKDRLDEPTAPVIGRLQPASVPSGSGDTEVLVEGTGFTDETRVRSGGQSLQVVEVVSDTALRIQVPTALLANAGTLSIEFSNPAPGGGTVSADLEVT